MKPPLFGTLIAARYDVAEDPNWRKAVEDRRKLAEPIEMKPIETKAPPRPAGTSSAEGGEPVNRLPFIERDPAKHAAEVAERARQRIAERAERERNRGKTGGRGGGRKRRPRPR